MDILFMIIDTSFGIAALAFFLWIFLSPLILIYRINFDVKKNPEFNRGHDSRYPFVFGSILMLCAVIYLGLNEIVRSWGLASFSQLYGVNWLIGVISFFSSCGLISALDACFTQKQEINNLHNVYQKKLKLSYFLGELYHSPDGEKATILECYKNLITTLENDECPSAGDRDVCEILKEVIQTWEDSKEWDEDRYVQLCIGDDLESNELYEELVYA